MKLTILFPQILKLLVQLHETKIAISHDLKLVSVNKIEYSNPKIELCKNLFPVRWCAINKC